MGRFAWVFAKSLVRNLLIFTLPVSILALTVSTWRDVAGALMLGSLGLAVLGAVFAATYRSTASE